MAGNINSIGPTVLATPYAKTKTTSQNTKELFDLAKPMQQGPVSFDRQKAEPQTAKQIIEQIKQQFVSNDSQMVSAGLKKLLDTAILINNKAGTPILKDKEIRQFMLKPEMLLKELDTQKKGASIFKGELFDALREALKTNPQVKSQPTLLERLSASTQEKVQPQLQNGENTQQEAKAGTETKQAQAQASTPKGQEAIKESVVNLLRQYANTYIKAQRSEPEFRRAEVMLEKAADQLMETLKEAGPAFTHIKDLVEVSKPNLASMILRQASENVDIQPGSVMDKVLDLIMSKMDEGKGSDNVKLLGEQIVRGMLNSNTMNQPILHFVLPTLFEDMNAFAEMWVDPDAEGIDGKGAKAKKGKSTRVFLTIDLEEKGKAEVDIMLTNGKVYTGLYYPPDMAEAFKSAGEYISAVTREAGFAVGDITIEPLEIPRALDEAVGKPIERRMVLDAKV